jgi:hypothetical protein
MCYQSESMAVDHTIFIIMSINASGRFWMMMMSNDMHNTMTGLKSSRIQIWFSFFLNTTHPLMLYTFGTPLTDQQIINL